MARGLLFLFLMMFSFTSYAYKYDDTIEALFYEDVDEGIICINYRNCEHVIKNCKFKAKVSFSDTISGQYKTVRGNNFSKILGFQEIRICFDFSDQLKVYDPWSGEELQDEWVASSLGSTFVQCVPSS